ncbi:sensor domain-containing diguanylate cyclase [Marinobacter profundi]|uniref:diguanylate cyclase n=1 Tax=Marinobacter profundi TaxID=2666256 RepID=A0A2G1ULQ4_9GAMM|nr:diguanylate cyclase [Marinobacter profundi]PHQ15408.1 GGDEF domain-containing protein [Marinobacter profundi]
MGKQSTVSGELLARLAAGVPGVLFTYWLSATEDQHCFPFLGERARPLFGLAPEALAASADPLFALIHPEDVAGLADSIVASARTLTPWQYRGRLRLQSGEFQWFEGSSTPERQDDGSTLWYGYFNNIQYYKELEVSLRESEAEFAFQAQFQKLIAKLSTRFINLGFGTIDQGIDELLMEIGKFFGVDRAYLYHFSDDYRVMTNSHEWCGKGVPSLKASQQQVAIESFHWWHDRIHEMVSRGRVIFVEDVRRLPKRAHQERKLLLEQGVASMFCVPVQIRGRVTGFFGVDSLRKRQWRRDQADLLVIISGLLSGALERHRLEEKLLNQSIRDPLTGLHNRRYLIPRLEELLGRSQRFGDTFSLALFDVDHFKQINDSVGHLAGDHILRQFAGVLRQQARTTDVVVRFGGEEFIVVFVGTAAEDAVPIVQRIIEAVRQALFQAGGSAVHVTVSAGMVGLGEVPALPDTPDSLIGRADERLYRAKAAGRDCLVSASGIVRI